MTNGTFSEASRSPDAGGLIVLATRGKVVAPALDNAVYISTGIATASNDIRYVGPPANLTVTLLIQGIETANLGLTTHQFTVRCGPSPAIGFSLQPLGTSHTFTMTRTFAVTDGATFPLECLGKVGTSGSGSTVPRWAQWSLEAVLTAASIDVAGQSFELGSASLPIRYWPPAAPASVTTYGQSCANGAGSPTTAAVGVPSIGNALFGIDVASPATSFALLGMGFAPVPPLPLGNGCYVLTGNDVLQFQVTGTGTAHFPIPIPAAADLLDLAFDVQGANLSFAPFEVAAASALRLVIGY